VASSRYKKPARANETDGLPVFNNNKQTNLQMKTQFHIILLCLAGLAFCIGCEKTTVQADNQYKTPQGGWINITPRTVEDCDDCPVDYCCCAIEIWGFTDEADISVCGFSNGGYLCGTFDPPGTTCPNVAGIGEDIVLEDDGLRRVAVCKDKNGSFRIFNNGGTTITVRMTCRYDLTNPVWTIINIPGHSAVYYSTDSNCALSSCS
jgi:hypothetical protein